jgi:hypothetical protein
MYTEPSINQVLTNMWFGMQSRKCLLFLQCCAPQVMTDMGFEVDFKLKGIITCLNKHGFTTTNSCQVGRWQVD